MKVLVCGGRDFKDQSAADSTLDDLHERHGIRTVVHGGARGADKCAHNWAEKRGIDIKTYTADWNRHGKSAGYIRNREMLDAEKPDLVVAFPGGDGTAHMVNLAHGNGYKVIHGNMRE